MQQQRQGQARKAVQARTNQINQARILQQQRLRQLKQLRERARKADLKKAEQRSNDVALASSLRSTRALSATKTPAFKKRVADVRDNLKKLKANQIKLNKENANKLKQQTQKAASIAKQKAKIRCVGKDCYCSFDGDTLVKTKRGMVAIRDIKAGKDFAWSRDARNGEMDWKLVTNHYSNVYQERVEIRYQGEDGGQVQTVISNRIHPIFVQIPANDNVQPSSEGHLYKGPIKNGHWIDADNLKPGYRLLNSDGGWSNIVSIGTSAQQLTAYNLTIEGFHTYFVSGSDDSRAFWVHNDCLSGLSKLQIKTVLKTASQSHKGTTQVGHALSKHAGRKPEIWGKTHGPSSGWHKQAMKHLRAVVRAPGKFVLVKNSAGISFLEKRLADGRGVRLNRDLTFKGFID
jgi:hypothetical protein